MSAESAGGAWPYADPAVIRALLLDAQVWAVVL